MPIVLFQAKEDAEKQKAPVALHVLLVQIVEICDAKTKLFFLCRLCRLCRRKTKVARKRTRVKR